MLRNGCLLLSEGKGHSIYFNARNNKVSAVPRHPDIKQFTAEKIWKLKFHQENKKSSLKNSDWIFFLTPSPLEMVGPVSRLARESL